MSYFSANNITKQYAATLALDNVSIHVPKGTVYGLLGPNGAGKTTLIRIINRITAPDSGSIQFTGENFSDNSVSRIGYLPEERGLYKKMKVGEQALYLARLKGMSSAKARESLDFWFTKLEISGWRDKKIEELSKGMAQKVQFATTLLHDPELLILDEPFSGFDPVNASILKSLVLELKEQGKTIILSTHDMGSVEELCDYITLIDKSRTILEGKVAEIKQKFKLNKFELIYAGKNESDIQRLNELYTISNLQSLADGNYRAVIQVGPQTKGNELLRRVIDMVEVQSFREILPSMNEVFINSVSKTSNITINGQD
jgi:ABC-2 type transport system ATP-binding protein